MKMAGQIVTLKSLEPFIELSQCSINNVFGRK
jgi:hypothetical protein